MKVSNIVIDSVLGISHVDVALPTPCTLFSGENGAGKSSIYHAVRMALTHDIQRAELKREYKSIVKEGAKTGTIAIRVDDGMASIELPTGDPEGWAALNKDLVRAVIDSQKFVKMEDADRRKFLFSLAGLKLNPDTICERMTEKGCAPECIKEIKPMLPAGFENSHKEAQRKATEARGGWKAITNETYGDKKGAAWKATAELLTEAEAAEGHELETELIAIERQLAAAHERLGGAQSEQRAVNEYAGKLTDAKTRAATFAEHDSLWQKADAELKKWTDKVAKLSGAATTYPCPDCGTVLILAGDKLQHAPAAAQHDPSALHEAQNAAAVTTKVRDRHKANRDAADAAAKELDALEKNKPVPPKHAPDAIQETVNSLTTDMRSKRERKKAIDDKNAGAEQSTVKTKRAAEYHHVVQEWSKIVGALAPEGIPAEILAEGLKPINSRLRDTAIATDWAQVVIGADMQITADGRPWRLISGSEQWRVGAMICEAISHLSKLKLLMLDEVDVLLPAHRVELILWLDTLAQRGEIDTAMLFMAAKAMPKGLPGSFTVQWVEGGKIVAEVA